MQFFRVLMFIFISNTVIYSQEMFFKIEEKTSPDTTFMGGSNFSFFARESLSEILIYASGMYGNPVLSKNISLEYNPILKMEAYSKFISIEYMMFKGVVQELLNRYNLILTSSNSDIISSIYIRAVDQSMPSPMESSGMSLNKQNGFDITNTEMASLCWWFALKGIIVKIEEKELLMRKATFKIPACIVENAAGKEKEIQALLEANGIHCEIVKEPALMIVPKE